MKKLKYYISIVFIATLTLSACEKHKLLYQADIVKENQVMLQVHYFEPISTADSNIINQVQINSKPVTLNNLLPYNAIPDGATGKFFIANAGEVNFKLFRGSATAGYTEVYNKSINLAGGKAYNIFIHDFDTIPVAIENGYPFQRVYPGYYTDSICYERFYNFYYDSDGTPLCKNGDKLQLQYVYYQTTAADVGWTPPYPLTDTFTVGEPIGFGEATEWAPLHIRKTYHNSSGYMPVRWFIRLIKADGTKSWVPYTSSATSGYTVWTYAETQYIGRRYHQILGGKSGGGEHANQIWSFKKWTAI